MDDAKLPPALRPVAEAIELVCAAPRYGEGWRAITHPDAPCYPLRPGAPPYDGIHRGSWTSPGVCVRLDLGHPAVPAEMRKRLRARFAVQIGADGAFYEYGVDHRSQIVNRDHAIAQLLAKVTGDDLALVGVLWSARDGR